MSEYIITIEQIKDLVTQSATEAIDGYKSGVVKQIWNFPKLPEIVRCCDCLHFANWDGVKEFPWCVLHGIAVEPDGFCVWAERRQL